MKTERYDVFGTKVTRISPKRLKRLKRKYHIFELDMEIKILGIIGYKNSMSMADSQYVFYGKNSQNIIRACKNFEIIFCNPKNNFKGLLKYKQHIYIRKKYYFQTHNINLLFYRSFLDKRNCYVLFKDDSDKNSLECKLKLCL